MKRESNFEVLRTVAMFFIVLYHCLTHGIGDGYGFNCNHPITLANGLFSDFILVFSSIAVNLYVMISGYFLVDKNFKFSRIVRTWTNTCFYSCVVTLVFTAFQFIPFNLISLGKSFFPVSTDAYWFVLNAAKAKKQLKFEWARMPRLQSPEKIVYDQNEIWNFSMIYS